MDNARKLLTRLDELLITPVELTIYGRAALQLGFAHPKPEYLRSQDVDVVLWLGQAEELSATGNFWEALGQLNREFDTAGLYLSHLFDENQVILSPRWRTRRIPVNLPLTHLTIMRLSDPDLALSKLMRYDPIDLDDLRFIISAGNLSADLLRREIAAARIPDSPEIQEQFELCKKWLLDRLEKSA